MATQQVMLDPVFTESALMNLGNLPLRRLALFCCGVVMTFLLSLGWLPAMAQANSEAVVVDGVPLFRVSEAAGLTAQERAATVEQELEALIQRGGSFVVNTEIRNGVPIIFVNDQYLLSVTQNDADLAGSDTPLEQADQWEKTLQTALVRSQRERQEGFILKSILLSLVILSAASFFHWLSGQFWESQVRRKIEQITAFGTQDGETELTGLNLLLRASLFLVRLGVWLGAAYYITNLFPFTREATYILTEGLADGLLARSLTLGDRSYSVVDLLILLALLLGLLVVSSASANLLKSRILHITGINRGSQEAIAVLAKYTLIFLGSVVILQIWGLDLSSLALLASALGVGIGLGLQNIAKDFVSGLIMVFERPIQVGDFVDFGEFLGSVERIGARSTEIRTLDHVSIIVPNSRFLEQEVINWSHRNPVSRIRLPVSVAYGSDPYRVKEALLSACSQGSEAGHILRAPAPQVLFTGFGDSALLFEVVVWISQPSRQIVIKSEMFFAIEASLRQYNIEIPFPQRDLHIRSGMLPVEVSPEQASDLLGHG